MTKLKLIRILVLAGVSSMPHIAVAQTTPGAALAASPSSAQASAASAPTQAPRTPQPSASQPSQPSGPANDTRASGDIIVTAQKREQAVNSVGMSITAATGAQLQTRGITQVRDLVKITPGLTFAQSNLGTPVYSIRGVGFYESTIASAPAVSVYVDEIPLPFAAESQGAPLDVQRVEVLKGPQGTLFGQNATGGAINYVAAKPTDHFEAGFNGSVERFGLVDLQGYVSGPVTDTLGVRASVHAVEGGQWQESITRPGDKLGKQDQIYGRVLLEWKPTSKLHAVVNLTRWHDQSDTQAPQAIAATPLIPNTPNQINVDPNITNYPYGNYGARKADWTVGWPMKRDSTFTQASARIDYDLTDQVTLTSISAYQRYFSNDYVDVDGTPEKTDDGRTGGKARTFYQEVRGTGKFGPLNLIVGANYDRDRTTGVQDYQISQASFGHPLGPYGTLPISNSDNETTQNIRTYAIFGNAEFALTDHITLQGGARYTHTHRNFYGCVVNNQDGSAGVNLRAISNAVRAAVGLPPVADPIPIGGCIGLDNISGSFLPSGYSSSLTEHNISWRGGVQYKLDGGGMLYANVSKGFKAGGFAALGASVNSEYAPVTQESLIAYEAGFKLPLFDRRLQLNAAGFYYDYSNKQLRGRVADPVFGSIEQLVNVPKSRVVGAEVDATLRPINGLTISASGTYIDSRILKDHGQEFFTIDPFNRNINFNGSPFPFTPKYSGTVDGEYVWSMGDLQPFIGSTLFHQSVTNYFFRTKAEPESVSRIKPYTTLDVRLGVGRPDGAWRVMLFGRNVTNTKYWTSVFLADTAVRYYAKPATYGVQVSLKFR